MFTAVVMASGRAKRFGYNKLLLTLWDKSVFLHVLEAVLTSAFDEHIVVSCYDEILNKAASIGFSVVFNSESDEGQSSSVRLGVKAANTYNNYAFFSCDQPFIKKSTINSMLVLSEDNPDKIIVPRYGERNGAPCIFGNCYRDSLLALTGDNGGKIVIKKNIERVVYFEIENELELFDIDTVYDYEYLKRIVTNH